MTAPPSPEWVEKAEKAIREYLDYVGYDSLDSINWLIRPVATALAAAFEEGRKAGLALTDEAKAEWARGNHAQGKHDGVESAARVADGLAEAADPTVRITAKTIAREIRALKAQAGEEKE